MQKKILFLGGSHFQLAPILYAKRQGHYVITCDYLPDNPGHQFADAYFNVSTTDKEAVLQLAQQQSIHGIVAFASDPSAPTAAYVANILNLVGNPFESVLLLTRKDLFREFLKKNQFNVPISRTVSSLEEAYNCFSDISKPLMVKPVDSSGSKGVTKVKNIDGLSDAYNKALSFSQVRKVILEEFIERKGYQIAGDGFMQDGKLVFKCFAQEHFNRRGNPFVPVGESFPSQLADTIQNKIHNEIQRLLSLLQMRIGGLNFDILLNHQLEVYLMEIGPRCGGNLISEIIKYVTGIDLAKLVVDSALNFEIEDQWLIPNQPTNYCSSYMLHSLENGFFQGIEFSPTIEKNIIGQVVFVKKGDFVQRFDGSNHTLGYLILKFLSAEEMHTKMETMNERVKLMIST
jgi:biotin carboxylase